MEVIVPPPPFYCCFCFVVISRRGSEDVIRPLFILNWNSCVDVRVPEKRQREHQAPYKLQSRAAAAAVDKGWMEASYVRNKFIGTCF